MVNLVLCPLLYLLVTRIRECQSYGNFSHFIMCRNENKPRSFRVLLGEIIFNLKFSFKTAHFHEFNMGSRSLDVNWKYWQISVAKALASTSFSEVYLPRTYDSRRESSLDGNGISRSYSSTYCQLCWLNSKEFSKRLTRVKSRIIHSAHSRGPPNQSENFWGAFCSWSRKNFPNKKNSTRRTKSQSHSSGNVYVIKQNWEKRS